MTYLANAAYGQLLVETVQLYTLPFFLPALLKHGMKLSLEIGQHFGAGLQQCHNISVGFVQHIVDLHQGVQPPCFVSTHVRSSHEYDAIGSFENSPKVVFRGATRDDQSLRGGRY